MSMKCATCHLPTVMLTAFTYLISTGNLTKHFNMQIVASGGVSSMEDVSVLSNMGLFGAIVGKAIYTGAIDLSDAIKLADFISAQNGGN